MKSVSLQDIPTGTSLAFKYIKCSIFIAIYILEKHFVRILSIALSMEYLVTKMWKTFDFSGCYSSIQTFGIIIQDVQSVTRILSLFLGSDFRSGKYCTNCGMNEICMNFFPSFPIQMLFYMPKRIDLLSSDWLISYFVLQADEQV